MTKSSFKFASDTHKRHNTPKIRKVPRKESNSFRHLKDIKKNMQDYD